MECKTGIYKKFDEDIFTITKGKLTNHLNSYVDSFLKEMLKSERFDAYKDNMYDCASVPKRGSKRSD